MQPVGVCPKKKPATLSLDKLHSKRFLEWRANLFEGFIELLVFTGELLGGFGFVIFLLQTEAE